MRKRVLVNVGYASLGASLAMAAAMAAEASVAQVVIRDAPDPYQEPRLLKRQPRKDWEKRIKPKKGRRSR
jgi:pimeloyl-ACP methyl ester carboxylesterase